MSTVTYAFATIQAPDKVRLWCIRQEGRGDRFYVINRAWTLEKTKGGFWIRDEAGVVGGGMALDVVQVWSGVVPPPHNHNYNAAIAWIEQDIQNRKQAVRYSYTLMYETPEDLEAAKALIPTIAKEKWGKCPVSAPYPEMRVIAIRIASPWPAERIAGVLLADAQTNQTRAEVLSVTEEPF